MAEEFFLLSIMTRNDMVNSLHATEDDAKRALHGYVKRNWTDSMRDHAIPRTAQKAVDDYFDPDYGVGESESYIIEKLPAPAAEGVAAARAKA